ncbi:MAG: hypothetical protein KJI71_03630, partial [Patescibacteria group bacterium]|nr:hypothetical protein [Patescibacteria group bacterium]
FRSLEGKGGKIVIPQGVEKYYHFYNSYVNEDIFVKRDDKVYLSSGFNPLGRDRNFRFNKCLGYLTSDYDFPISFPKSCPRPNQEKISYLEPYCQNYILNIGKCEIPDYSKNSRIYNDSECALYINNNLSNIGCFRNYSEDENFLGNSWYIYLDDKNIITDDDCDAIYLRDQNGLVIDRYPYGIYGKAICK